MSTETRLAILSALEQEFSTRIICYLTGDRQGMPTQIGSDAVPRFRRHLESIGDTGSITLFLYSRGGDTNVPWRLVNLIREYCKKFEIIVPFRSHSAATLLCLGADAIHMGKMSELSSIDPSVANPFNPPDPINPGARVPISVEDVNAFRDLAKRFGITETDGGQSVQVFMALASKVDPLALGNVERSYKQIRKLAEDLLHLHIDEAAEVEKRIKGIVDTLTQQLFSHQHLINRREASKIGLNVKAVTNPVDKAMWELLTDFANEMELDEAFNAPRLLGSQGSVRIDLKRAFIESQLFTDCFISTGQIVRLGPMAVQLPPGVVVPPGMQPQIPVAVQIESEEWRVLR